MCILHRVGWIIDKLSQCRPIGRASVGTKVVTEVLVIILDRDSGENYSVSQCGKLVNGRVFCSNRGYAVY